MDERCSVETCRWARPTVRLPYPYWLDSEDKPWACLREPEPKTLEDTDVCKECPRWDPRHLAVSLPRI